MSLIYDFDTPNFLEVIAYLHGVADGIRASRRGSATLATCASPQSASTVRCVRAASLAATGGNACEPHASSIGLSIAQTLIASDVEGINTAWPNVLPIAPPQGRWMEAPAAVVEAASPTVAQGATHRTVPYLSSAVSMEPAAADNEFPSEDRASGVCLRVVPLSPAWYSLTGTNDER